MQFKQLTVIVRHGLMLLLMSHPFFNTAYAEQKTYTVGVVPQFESSRIKTIWQPILNRISEISGVPLKLKASHNPHVFETQFKVGIFDFAFMNPYHAIVANEKEGYLPLLRDIDHDLFGIIVVRKDSPFQSVEELNGKTIAFPSPNALGASLLPRAEFKSKFNIKVKERYVKTHSSVFLNVIFEQVDAGGAVLKTLAQQPENIRRQLRILYKTEGVPPHPFVVHPRVDKNIQEKITQAFIALGESESGRELLNMIPIKKIGKTSLIDYRSLKKMNLPVFYNGK